MLASGWWESTAVVGVPKEGRSGARRPASPDP